MMQTDLETQAQTIAQFASYLDELSLQDVTQKYRCATIQRLRVFQAFLEGQSPSPYLAKKFLARLRDKGYKPATIKAYYIAIKPFLEYLGIPFKVKLHRSRRLPAYHSAAQVNSMLQIATCRSGRWAKLKHRDALIILMLALTGLRKSELLNLRPYDIAGGFIHVRSGKGDKDRTIPLASDLVKPLAAYIKSNNISPTDRLFSVKARELYNIVKRYALAAGIPDLSPHTLRHFFATTLVEKGAQLRAVQELLGHTYISTNAIYLDVVPAHLQSTISLLDKSVSVSNKNISLPGKRSISKSLSLSLSNEQRRGETRCGLSLKRGKSSMPSLILAPLKALPSTGQGNEASSAWARAAPIAFKESPKDGDTRPSSLLAEIRSVGSSESKP